MELGLGLFGEGEMGKLHVRNLWHFLSGAELIAIAYAAILASNAAALQHCQDGGKSQLTPLRKPFNICPPEKRLGFS